MTASQDPDRPIRDPKELIALADQLFRRDIAESINEATQLYMMAATLLEDRPEQERAELKATVDDRLLKIRQCQNIEGVRREVPLFEVPADPALLSRARK
jgi:hypothetical protein